MIPGLLIKEQIKKISTFLYILLFLFILNILFQILFNWEGISIIVNVYLYVFSFYLIFNFSLIEIDPLKFVYRERYGIYGDFILFSVTRLLPFAIIYIVTVIFILINYYSNSFWPWRPILNLLDGRFSNIVFYSLILLVILKLKREPRVTIPLFLSLAIIYFSLYKLVYTFSPMGIAISSLKYFQITMGFFFLLFEFSTEKRKIIKAIFLSITLSAGVYISLVGVYNMVYKFSSFGSYSHIKSSTILLTLGYKYPLNDMRNVIIRNNNPQLLITMIKFFDYYNDEIQLNNRQWEDLILKGNVSTINEISRYIKEKGITLSCEKLISEAQDISKKNGAELIESNHFTQYCSTIYKVNRECFHISYDKNNVYYKIWLIRVLRESKDPESIPFLIDKITGFNDKIALETYNALVEITGIKKVKELNDLKLVESYNSYYNDYRRNFK